jgi:hypothetical protein
MAAAHLNSEMPHCMQARKPGVQHFAAVESPTKILDYGGQGFDHTGAPREATLVRWFWFDCLWNRSICRNARPDVCAMDSSHRRFSCSALNAPPIEGRGLWM